MARVSSKTSASISQVIVLLVIGDNGLVNPPVIIPERVYSFIFPCLRNYAQIIHGYRRDNNHSGLSIKEIRCARFQTEITIGLIDFR